MAGDHEYIYAFDRIIEPVLNDFKPSLIFVSCGFDSAQGDPLGGQNLTKFGYNYILQKLLKFNNGKVILVLEGGYELGVITDHTLNVIEQLVNFRQDSKDLNFEVAPSQMGIQAVQATLKEIQPKWKVLSN